MINYEKMRIKLEFLYRILNYNNVVGQGQLRMSAREMEQVNSITATVGLNLIYLHRKDDSFVYADLESVNARAIGQVLAQEIMNLDEKIRRECKGLPITLTITRHELLIREGVDKIIELVKDLIEGKEVANG